MGTGSGLTNIGIVAPDEPNFVGIEMDSGSRLTNVGVEGAAIGAYARDISDVSITDFKYRGGGRAFDITGERASITGSRIQTVPDVSSRTRVGYTKPNGPPLPALCPRCKSIFPSRHYNVAVPRFLVKNNVETCPVCRDPNATLAEGLFDLVGEFARVIEAEHATISMLHAMGAIASEVVNGSSDIEEAIRKIELISPKAADVLRRPLAQKAMAALFFLFLSLASLNQLAEFNKNYQPAHVVTAIYTAMSQYIVERISENEYSVKEAKKQKEPRIAHSRGDQVRNHREQLNNSTAMPRNIPVPTSKPTRPKSDR